MIIKSRRSCAVSRPAPWIWCQWEFFSSCTDQMLFYLVSFNYCPLNGPSVSSSWPLSGVSVNYELYRGTGIYCCGSVSAAWSHLCVPSLTDLSTWRLLCQTADMLTANSWLCTCSAECTRWKLLQFFMLMFWLMHRELSWSLSKWWRLSTKKWCLMEFCAMLWWFLNFLLSGSFLLRKLPN